MLTLSGLWCSCHFLLVLGSFCNRSESTALRQLSCVTTPACLEPLSCCIYLLFKRKGLLYWTQYGCKHSQSLLEAESQHFHLIVTSKPMFWSVEPREQKHITVLMLSDCTVWPQKTTPGLQFFEFWTKPFLFSVFLLFFSKCTFSDLLIALQHRLVASSVALSDKCADSLFMTLLSRKAHSLSCIIVVNVL